MKKIIGLLIVILMAMSCNPSASQNKREQLTDWAMENTQKIESLELTESQNDLSSLEQIIGSAEIVCLGENRHDLREQFQLKHRFIKYLVEEMGFTTFALEASLPYSVTINNYILNGKGNIDEIMSNMPGWFLWDTEEIKAIFQWLRTFNQNPSNNKKVNFYGIDIVAPNNALEQIFEYLQKVDKSFFEQIQNLNFAQEIIEDNHWPTSLQRYAQLPEGEKGTLSTNYTELYQHIKQNKENYISLSSKNEYEWILKIAYSAREANKMFSEEDRLQMGLIRDQAMANIALWVKENNEKMILWAHNVHIAKSEFSMTVLPGSKIKGMGYLLNEALDDRLVSIGASFNQGRFQQENRRFESAPANTIDGVLAKLKTDYFIINLKKKPEDINVENWLNSDQIIRGQDFEMSCQPGAAFDAIYFTNTVSKVRYNPTTLERLGN